MPIPRDTLTSALAGFLGEAPRSDAGANGLQLAGATEVRRVATAVSASLATIEAAAAQGADALIVHHGLWFPTGGAALSVPLTLRLRALVRHDLSLYGYHYLLDAHPDVGNAASLARALDATPDAPFGTIDGQPWGWTATLPAPEPVAAFGERLRALRGSDLPAAHAFGPATVRTLGIVTGSASSCLPEAAEKGLDALLVGDVKEGTQEEAREYGISLFALGHAHSETYGPRALAAWIQRELGIEAAFVDVPNPA